MSASEVRAAVEAAFRDYKTDGVASSGSHEPVKSEIRDALGRLLESTLSSIGAAILRFATVANMNADTSRSAGTLAYVYANNGSASDAANKVYQWSGSAWVEATWYYNAVAAVVQPLVDEAEGYATDAANAAAAVAAVFTVDAVGRFNAAYNAIKVDQSQTYSAPAVPATGTASTNINYAFFNKDARFAQAAPLTSFEAFLTTAGDFRVIIAVATAANTLIVVDSFTLTASATGLQKFFAANDFDPRIVPAGAYVGVFQQTGGAVFATKTGVGGGWFFYNGDPGSTARAYSSFGAQMQYTASSLPSVAGIADARDLAARQAAFLANVSTNAISVADSYGRAAPADKLTAPSGFAVTTYVQNIPHAGGWLESVRAFIGEVWTAAPALDVVILRPLFVQTTAGTLNSGIANAAKFRVVDRFTLPAKIGANDWRAGVDFANRKIAAGDYVGYVVSTAALAQVDYEAGTEGNWYLYADPGAIGSAAPATGYSYFNASSNQFGFTLRRTPIVPAAPSGRAARVTLESTTFAGVSLPSGWTATSGWTVNDALISPPSTTGYGVQAYSNKKFNLEERTTRLTLRFLASGTIAGVGFRADSTGIANVLGSLFLIDMVNNRLVQTQAWTATQAGAGTGPTGLQVAAIPFTLVTARDYLVEIKRYRRFNTITIFDPVSGASASLTDANYGSGLGLYNYNDLSGEQNGTLAFVNVAGQFRVTAAKVLSDIVSPRVWIGGDSLTDGYGLPGAMRYAALLRDAVKSGVVISGMTGDRAAGIAAKAQSELPALLPAIAIAVIGTNDQDSGLAAFQTNINAFLAQCDALSIMPVLAVPAPFGTQVYTNMRAWLLGLGRRLLRPDLALTTGNDGVTANTALFQTNDGYAPGHWNADGHAAVFARFAMDVPEVFD